MRYQVRFTNFHSGQEGHPSAISDRVYSRHRSLDAAKRKLAQLQRGGCTCGCAAIVDAATSTIIEWR